MDSRSQGRPLFSVIIPARNEGSCLPVCISSILAQSLLSRPGNSDSGSALEIILVDNGSTDATAALAAALGAQVLALPEARTVAELRNAGAALAKGELLAFLDADMEMPPAWLEYAAKMLSRDQNVPAPDMPVQDIRTKEALPQNVPAEGGPTHDVSPQNASAQDALTQNVPVQGQDAPTQNVSAQGQDMRLRNTPVLDALALVTIPPEQAPAWIIAWERRNVIHGVRKRDFLTTQNLVVRREAFEAAGGFDQTLATGEDKDFSIRLGRLGYCCGLSAELKAVHHGVERSLAELIRKEFWRQRHALSLARKHGLPMRLLRFPLLSLAIFWSLAAACILLFVAPVAALFLLIFAVLAAFGWGLVKARHVQGILDKGVILLISLLRFCVAGCAISFELVFPSGRALSGFTKAKQEKGGV